jgi:serine/threonine protein kinase
MSAEPSELMSEVWTRWQGHVIHDAFPLGRCLGCSDHSGVFLTESAAPDPSKVAVKLVPTDRALAESLLPQWKRAVGIVHPHLLRLLQSGGCQLDGLPYLYVVMEYADQTLAQLLQCRALTDDEAREMLRPTLDALAFLHGQNLVQGQLKPANILVVGDQLKLASDTIRRVAEGPMSAKALTVYDPPEAQHGSSSTAGDIWALGVCLFEALTRRLPSARGERGEAVALPTDFSPALRDVVARCLNPSPQNRPSVTELVAWARGQPAGSAPNVTIQPAAIVPLEPTPPEPTPPRITPPPAAPEAARPAPSIAQSPNPRALLTALLGGVVILALVWTGVRMVRSHGTSAPLSAPEGSLSQAPGATAPLLADSRKPISTVLSPKPSRSDLAASPLALHAVIPEISESARRTIIGHIKVWVRVIVDQDGSVYAATADRAGPSRYFQRLSVEAAKNWTFPPTNIQSRRLMQIRFDFSRDETTGRAVTLN